MSFKINYLSCEDTILLKQEESLVDQKSDIKDQNKVEESLVDQELKAKAEKQNMIDNTIYFFISLFVFGLQVFYQYKKDNQDYQYYQDNRYTKDDYILILEIDPTLPLTPKLIKHQYIKIKIKYDNIDRNSDSYESDQLKLEQCTHAYKELMKIIQDNNTTELNINHTQQEILSIEAQK